MAPRVGFEPTTLRLTAECSTAELSRNKNLGSDLLSQGMTPSTISAVGLNLCVRYGNWCFPYAIATEKSFSLVLFAPSKSHSKHL